MEEKVYWPLSPVEQVEVNGGWDESQSVAWNLGYETRTTLNRVGNAIAECGKAFLGGLTLGL